MKMPSKLFHYTTINNLALILKSASIRFGRLDKVNDITEGEADDFHSFAPYIFISCWTHNTEENLALWNMYTPQMRGVRIELPLPIFSSHTIGSNSSSLIPEQEIVDEDRLIFILPGKNEPFKVEYTNDPSKLRPRIKNPQGLEIAKLGQYKNTIWSIEEEYRFRLTILPLDKKRTQDFPTRYERLIDQRIPPPIDGYLLKIMSESFEQMKIVAGPKIINGDLEIINALISKYNPTATLESSVLKGHIR